MADMLIKSRAALLARVVLLSLLYSLLMLSATCTFAADSAPAHKPVVVQNPGVDLWRAVNPQQPSMAERAALAGGTSQARGVQSDVLINQQGERWRQFRMAQLLPIGGALLAGALSLVLLFYLLRGKVLLKEGESDHKLLRYSVYERMIHWFLAMIFLFLGLTGLILLFGRSLLLPWMGPELFAAIASAAKEGHNLFGPLFLLALLLMFLQFVVRNIYQRGDLTWLLRGGGIIGNKEVPSNFFNMGEKSMFWLLVFAGGAIGLSGLVLLFPVFGQGREIMGLAHVVHAIGAVIMLTVIIGHIYIGSIGMQGAIDGMTSGYCDLNWARDHHSWWAQKAIEQGKAIPKDGRHRDKSVNAAPAAAAREAES